MVCMSLLLAPSTKQESVEKIAKTQKLLHKNNSCHYCADLVKKRGDELMLSLPAWSGVEKLRQMQTTNQKR